MNSGTVRSILILLGAFGLSFRAFTAGSVVCALVWFAVGVALIVLNTIELTRAAKVMA
jgi:hypothetical protein